MEVDNRTFATVRIGFHSIKNGPDRFKKDDLYDPPPHALWRNNLTALSQRHNLYFVASRSSILVYRPEFPFQTLGRTAHLVIPQALAQVSAEGYIDPGHAHSINHLMVGDLGNQEILLLATDSGNIAAYYTQSIQEAILRNPFSLGANNRSDVLGLQPFFTHWVHESAWGLSIHTQARMIAVSANTPFHVPADDPCATVWVFAFALTDHGGGAEGFDDEADPFESSSVSDWHDWDPSRGVDYPSRDRNYKIVLAGFDGHDSNIPCVSFVNTSQDPYGRWLLSTDIDGATKIWHIWRAMCHRSWDLTERGPHRGFRRRREGGWLVAALAPEMFGLAQTMEEFCGYSRAAFCYGSTGESYDLTNVVRLRTPGHSHAHPLLDEASDDSDDDRDWDGPSNMWSDEEISNEDESITSQQSPILHSQLLFDPTTQEERPTTSSDTYVTALEDHSSSQDVQSMEFGESEAEPHNDESPFSVSVVVEIPEAPVTDQEVLEPELHYDSSSDEYENEVSSLSQQSASSLSSLAQRTCQEVEELIQAGYLTYSKTLPPSVLPPKIPAFPLLHCSASNLRLFNGPEAESAHVYCASILTQALPPILEVHHFSHFDRLNMIQIIPTLGIVVIASQIGRCAICVLTKSKNGTFGLRTDWTLPTRKQECHNVRPLKPLLGIAVSPVQGQTRSEYSESSSEGETHGGWGTDGVVDGVGTTFDPAVVMLRVDTHRASEDGQGAEVESSPLDAGREAKRKRLSYEPQDLPQSGQHRELREWSIPEPSDPWNAAENGTRYRLMLTYSDFTVITYELSRGVERGEIAQGHVSSMDLVD